MITSNLNEILLKNQIETSLENSIDSEPFIDSLIDTKIDETRQRTSDFTYENIRGISLEEIDSIFNTTEDRQMAKNLRLATLFTEDKHLGHALFNTVLGQPFQVGLNYLSDTFEDKHNFLKSITNKENSLSDLLHQSVSKKLENKDNIEVIPQEYLDEILLEINSFSFLSTLSSNSKDQYGRYKDKDDDYSFLYNDYYMKYQELLYKYNDSKEFDRNLINQF